MTSMIDALRLETAECEDARERLRKQLYDVTTILEKVRKEKDAAQQKDLDERTKHLSSRINELERVNAGLIEQREHLVEASLFGATEDLREVGFAYVNVY